MGRHAFRRWGGDDVAVLPHPEHRADAACFADEVALDFPSMTHALERIRHGLLGDERRSALPTALRLSRSEATEGAVRPLHVPVRLTCRVCGGRGETWAAHCVRCEGSGIEVRRHEVQVSIPAGVSHGARFHFSVVPRHEVPTRIELRIVVG